MLSGNDKERQIKPIEHASWNAINAIYVTFNGFWCLLKVKLWTIYTYLERTVGFVYVSCMQCDKAAKSKKNTQTSTRAINFVIHSHYRFHMIWTKANSLCIWNSRVLFRTRWSGFFNQTHNKQYLFIDQCIEERALHRWAIYSGFSENS